MAARTRMLRLGPGFSMPADLVTQAVAVLAVRRAGKSNGAVVMAEEMYREGLPWFAIDPKGDWWGIRSSADGKSPGLPIPVFGGDHGDMPLLDTAGELMARLIVGHNLTCVLDVSNFSKAGRVRFLTAFGTELYRLHKQHPQPRFAFLEEAERIIPQIIPAGARDMAACVGVWSDIVCLGGFIGLGVGVLSQRSARVAKDVLTQVEVMIAMRTTSPQDRAVIKSWLDHHAQAAQVVDSLPALANGEAWVSSAHFLAEAGMDPLFRARFRLRETFDSAATPKVGQRPRPPATLADIDLGAIEEQMAAVAEEAGRNDPAALRRRVRELERRLQDAEELAALVPDLRARIAASSQSERQLAEKLAARPPALDPDALADLHRQLAQAAAIVGEAQRAAVRLEPAPDVSKASARMPAPVHTPAPARRAEPLPAGDILPPPDGAESRLGRPARKLLVALAQHGDLDLVRLAIMTGYRPGTGHFKNTLGALRTAGMISAGSPVTITDTGRAWLGDTWEPLPEGGELISWWMRNLSGPEGKVLQALLEAYPEPLTREETAAASGYSAGAGHFKNVLGRLRTLQLVTGDRHLAACEALGTIAERTRAAA